MAEQPTDQVKRDVIVYEPEPESSHRSRHARPDPVAEFAARISEFLLRTNGIGVDEIGYAVQLFPQEVQERKGFLTQFDSTWGLPT